MSRWTRQRREHRRLKRIKVKRLLSELHDYLRADGDYHAPVRDGDGVWRQVGDLRYPVNGEADEESI
jgi:hypothetical protein